MNDDITNEAPAARRRTLVDTVLDVLRPQPGDHWRFVRN